MEWNILSAILIPFACWGIPPNPRKTVGRFFVHASGVAVNAHKKKTVLVFSITYLYFDKWYFAALAEKGHLKLCLCFFVWFAALLIGF